MLGRKTLKSERARMLRIDAFFERTAQTLLIGYSLFVLVVWVTHRPSFFLDTIVIEGAHAVSAKDVHQIAENALKTKLLFLINRNNKTLYPTHTVLASVKEAFPRIASITPRFDSRRELHLAISEYVPAILYCMSFDTPTVAYTPDAAASSSPSLSDCYFADERGYVFAPAPEYSGFPFVAIIGLEAHRAGPSPVGTFALDIEKYESIQKFIATLQTLGLTAHAVELLPEYDVRIKTNKSWDILWTTTKDSAESIRNLKLVLDTFENEKKKPEGELNVIDLRFGNKIFYK